MLTIFDQTLTKEATEQGIQKAIDGANAAVEGWSETAFGYLLEYVKLIGPGGRFTNEQFRVWCSGNKNFTAPHSARAFGDVIRKAAKEKLISIECIVKTQSRTAHNANAALWIVNGEVKIEG